MQIFISGGCKNGKSMLAQKLAAGQRVPGVPLYYIATMQPADREDETRIARHLAERDGWGFETVEQPREIGAVISRCDRKGSFLLDSLTALLANEMFPIGGTQSDALQNLSAGLNAVLDKLERIVVVSDMICCDAERYDPLTETYRRTLARLERLCAARCGVVLELCGGGMMIHKGEQLLKKEGLWWF